MNDWEVAFMPRRDGTGPLGGGAMTGRGLGFCTGANAGAAGIPARGLGLGRRGFGRGLGMGLRGARMGGFVPVSDNEALTEEKEILEQRLEAIKQQLKEK